MITFIETLFTFLFVAINKSKTYKIALFVVFTLSIQIVNAQYKKNESKLRIIFSDEKTYPLTGDSIRISIYQKESVIKRINLSKIVLDTCDSAKYQDIIVEQGFYTILIENIANAPVLFVNANIGKGKIVFLPIDFMEFKSLTSKNIIIIDFYENYKRYLKKYPPIVN